MPSFPLPSRPRIPIIVHPDQWLTKGVDIDKHMFLIMDQQCPVTTTVLCIVKCNIFFRSIDIFLTTRFKGLNFDGGDSVFSCRHIFLRVSTFTSHQHSLKGFDF